MYPDPAMTVISKPAPVIAINESLSTAFNKKHYRKVLIFAPADWTAADITFMVCDTEEGEYVDLTYALDGLEVTAKMVEGVAIALGDKVLEALEVCPYVKIRSGTSALPVTQDAERTFRVVKMR